MRSAARSSAPPHATGSTRRRRTRSSTASAPANLVRHRPADPARGVVVAAVAMDGGGADVRGPLGARLGIERDGGVERLQRLVVLAAITERDAKGDQEPRALGDRKSTRLNPV